jgi:broad specificity phosphatase PhoE
MGSDQSKAQQPGQVTILVRHSKSRANEWQAENKDSRGRLPKVTPEIATEFDLFNAALSDAGVEANKKHRGILWRHIRHVAGNRKIRIFISPIKRVIQTLMESLDCEEAAFLFQNGPPKVSLMAILCEKGDGSENDGVLPEVIMEDADLDRELHGFRFKEMMDFTHFRDNVWHDNEQWWNVEFRQDVSRRAAGLEAMLKWRRRDWAERPTEGECVVCFTHWGFANAVSGMHMKNFGQDSDGDSQKLHGHAILEKLAPNKGWNWWRRSGQYD